MINGVMQRLMIYLQSVTMTALMIQPVGVAFATRITDVTNVVTWNLQVYQGRI